MGKIIRKRISRLINKTGWISEDIKWSLFKPYLLKGICEIPVKPFTIGITTFLNRYESCFKPLLVKIAALFPECQILVVANGHVNIEEQKKYIISIAKYCEQFKNVQIVSYLDPKGLSSIWNRIIEDSRHNEILILNDDIKIKVSFRRFMNHSGVLKTDIAVINKSWSHFMITKNIFIEIGLFDEGLVEIGGEDDDYSARLAFNRTVITNFRTSTIAGKFKPKQKKLEVNSYGKNMFEEIGGYSSYNMSYLQSKWIMSNEKFKDSFEVPDRLMKYWKLRLDDSNINTGNS